MVNTHEMHIQMLKYVAVSHTIIYELISVKEYAIFVSMVKKQKSEPKFPEL